MAKVLIPRSDSVSAKVIEPSDFESMFSDDIINDYVRSGFTLTAGSGLVVNIAIGKARLKGLFIHNDSASSKSSLSASATNHIYVTLTRDSNSEAESWDFTSNTTGVTATDSLFIGTATTNGSSVTAVSMTDVETISTQFLKRINHDFGDGLDGNVTISGGTTLTKPMQYNSLTINASQYLTGSDANLVIKVKGTLTVSGTIHMNGKVDNGSNTVGVGGGGAGTNGMSGGVGISPTELGRRSFGINAAGGTGGTGGNGGSSGQPAGAGVGAAGNGSETYDFLDNRIHSTFSVINSLPFAYGAGGGSGGGAGGGWKGSYNGSGGDGGDGGTGGNGGGSLIIIADTITINSGGLISANGGTGGNGENGTDGWGTNYQGGGGGGSGAGGGGGLVILVYNTLTNNGSVTVTGGAGGTAGSGINGSTNGAVGSSGSGGVFKSLQIT